LVAGLDGIPVATPSSSLLPVGRTFAAADLITRIASTGAAHPRQEQRRPSPAWALAE